MPRPEAVRAAASIALPPDERIAPFMAWAHLESRTEY